MRSASHRRLIVSKRTGGFSQYSGLPWASRRTYEKRLLRRNLAKTLQAEFFIKHKTGGETKNWPRCLEDGHGNMAVHEVFRADTSKQVCCRSVRLDCL